MRLLFACELYYPSVGGVQEVMRQVAVRLVERGHQVTVATTRLPERPGGKIDGVAIVEFGVSGNLVRGMSGDVDAYRNFVLQGEFDVFMVKAAQQWTFDALWTMLDEIPYPKSFIPCGFSSFYQPEYTNYYEGMPAILRKFDRLIFYASDYRDINFARTHGIEKFSVIPNGASEIEFGVAKDPGFRARHGIAAEDFVILTVGSLTGLKGHLEIAEAFQLADFRGRAATLILDGNIPTLGRTPPASSPLRSLVTRYRTEGALAVSRWLARATGRRLKRLIRRRPDDYLARLRATVDSVNGEPALKRILLLDLPRPDLVQAYLNSDLFVFASHIEYSPLVLYEAAAAGLPFLSVPVGNAEEIARWTRGGSICPAARDERGYIRVDPAMLAEHIVTMATDKAKLKSLGEAGHRNWQESYTWEKITDQYEAILAGLKLEHQRDDGTNPLVSRLSTP